MSVTGLPSSPPPPLRESGVVVSEPNLGVPFVEGVVTGRPPGVSTGVVAGPARSNVGWNAVKGRVVPPGVSAVCVHACAVMNVHTHTYDCS